VRQQRLRLPVEASVQCWEAFGVQNDLKRLLLLLLDKLRLLTLLQ
jgi:hypothetical protein